MKSEKGVTLTSIMIYVIALTIVVLTVGRIITYFYKNMDTVTSDTDASIAYMSFNSYFTEDINIAGNEVLEYSNDGNMKYIIFKETENQYTFKNGSIYKEKIKIAKNIDDCEFSYDQTSKTVTVKMKINNHEYSNCYTIIK